MSVCVQVATKTKRCQQITQTANWFSPTATTVDTLSCRWSIDWKWTGPPRWNGDEESRGPVQWTDKVLAKRVRAVKATAWTRATKPRATCRNSALSDTILRCTDRTATTLTAWWSWTVIPVDYPECRDSSGLHPWWSVTILKIRCHSRPCSHWMTWTNPIGLARNRGSTAGSTIRRLTVARRVRGVPLAASSACWTPIIHCTRPKIRSPVAAIAARWVVRILRTRRSGCQNWNQRSVNINNNNNNHVIP